MPVRHFSLLDFVDLGQDAHIIQNQCIWGKNCRGDARLQRGADITPNLQRSARTGDCGRNHSVDDHSRDETAGIARSLEGVRVYVHEVNKGYGSNQKNLLSLRLRQVRTSLS